MDFFLVLLAMCAVSYGVLVVATVLDLMTARWERQGEVTND